MPKFLKAESSSNEVQLDWSPQDFKESIILQTRIVKEFADEHGETVAESLDDDLINLSGAIIRDFQELVNKQLFETYGIKINSEWS